MQLHDLTDADLKDGKQVTVTTAKASSFEVIRIQGVYIAKNRFEFQNVIKGYATLAALRSDLATR